MDTLFSETLKELRLKANAIRLENQRKRRQEILALARGFPVTNSIIQAHFGVSRQTASQDLALLVNRGLLSRVGRGRRAIYIYVDT